ncbi:unnamed protein product [Toxocara canis]|uniref:SET domain-containing protein n=1 Tax=Toxocara canis TaxID=6265 RepID=A0A183VGE7_TOXCA|nr:unnamed protein product [Toxocara canis]
MIKKRLTLCENKLILKSSDCARTVSKASFMDLFYVLYFDDPWNREFHRYVVEVHDEEDENECCDMSPDNGFGLPAVLTDMVGLRTGGHTVLCFKYKHVPFLLAYCPPNRNSTLGDVIVFDASYSGPLRAYVIDFFKKKADVPSYGSKMMNFGTLPVLEVSARLSGLPLGYLRAVNDDLGIVHDRHGLLTPALLSAPKETIFEVYVADMRPNAFSRLSIRDVSEGTANLVKRYAALGYKPLKDLEGITIGSGRVFSREYAMLQIRFGNGSTDGWEELTPGTWIKFSAASDKGSPDFVVQKWTKSFERAAETVQHVCISEKYTVGFYAIFFNSSNLFKFYLVYL